MQKVKLVTKCRVKTVTSLFFSTRLIPSHFAIGLFVLLMLFIFKVRISTVNSSVVYRYLLEHGADVAAVNNDGDLAIDLAEGEDVEELLMQWMEKEGKSCHRVLLIA